MAERARHAIAEEPAVAATEVSERSQQAGEPHKKPRAEELLEELYQLFSEEGSMKLELSVLGEAEPVARVVGAEARALAGHAAREIGAEAERLANALMFHVYLLLAGLVGLALGLIWVW